MAPAWRPGRRAVLAGLAAAPFLRLAPAAAAPAKQEWLTLTGFERIEVDAKGSGR